MQWMLDFINMLFYHALNARFYKYIILSCSECQILYIYYFIMQWMPNFINIFYSWLYHIGFVGVCIHNGLNYLVKVAWRLATLWSSVKLAVKIGTWDTCVKEICLWNDRVSARYSTLEYIALTGVSLLMNKSVFMLKLVTYLGLVKNPEIWLKKKFRI